MFWDEWHQQLEKLDPEDENWAGADAFIRQLQGLLADRKKMLRGALEAALRELHESCVEELAYFEMEELGVVSADRFPKESIADSVDDVNALRDALIKHASIRLTETSTRKEDAANRSYLDPLAEQIVTLHKRLLKRTAEEDARDENSSAPPVAAAEPSTPRPARTATDEEVSDVTPSRKQISTPRVKRLDRLSAPPATPVLRALQQDACLEDLKDRGIVDDVLAARMGIKSPPVEEDDRDVDDLLESVLGEEIAEEQREGDGPAKETAEAESESCDAQSSETSQEETTVQADQREERGTPPVEDAQIVGLAQETPAGLLAEERRLVEGMGQLIRELVFDGDVSGAYWLCRSLESNSIESFCPSWLLAAVEAARCEPDRDRVAADELLHLTTGNEVPKTELCQLMAVSAAMYPALTTPQSNTTVWLNTDLTYPRLRRLIDGIADFCKHGRALRPEDIGERRSREDTEARLKEATECAGRWLADAPSRHTKLMRANRIWLKIVRPGGEVHGLLQIAARDSRSEYHKLKQALDVWRDRNEIVAKVWQMDLELHGKKVRPIQASPRDQIVNWIFDACSVADEWCRAVESNESIQSGSSWIDEQVNILGRCVQDHLNGAVDELQTLSQSDDVCQSAVAVCVLNGLRPVAKLFQCENQGLSDHWDHNAVEKLVLGQTGTVHHRLCSRLWLFPDIQFDNNGLPTSDSVRSARNSLALARRKQMNVRDAIEARMNQQDFRFVERLMETLERTEWTEVNERYQHLLETSRVSLGGHLSSVEIDIEKGISDGVIVHADRSEYQGTLSSIVPSQVELFAPELEKLDRIRKNLQSSRHDRLASQRLDWQEKRDRLLRLASPAEGARIKHFLDKALKNEDTRVVDECISRLEEAEHDAVEPRIDWFQAPDAPRDVLLDFQEKHSNLQKVLARSFGDVRQILASLGAKGQLPKPREEEASKAFYAWRKLRQSSPKSSLQLRTHVGRILDFIGLKSATVDDAIESMTARSDWAHFHAHVSAGGLALVPQFGSLRDEHYDVVCIWERPGAQTLGARIGEAGLAKQPAIVLYLGRLKQNQRLDLTRYCNRESLQIIVIDEILLAFLVGERDARFPVALAVALSFSAINPYAPHSAGNVPPEMFFGRDRMNRALQDFSGNGSCLVYGGRQLGKSALLRRVQREFHHPDQQRYAIYEDIRLVGDALAGQSADELWIRVRNQLNRLDIFSRSLTTDQSDRLVRRLLELLEQKKQMRILLLLDEADCFLEQDAKQQFAIVSRLKRLMEDSQRHFKVVFAGLHNVQRFQGIPNQPFAHLGVPLQVGPLSPLAARDLVKRPFEAVGHRFSDDSIVLRILSYTNYHPGLIQLFCSKLLDELHRKVSRDGSPPFTIEADDVQTVYSNRKLEQDIRDRFDWTLALDPRYQAIAWSIIEDQFEDRDSFARPYSSRDINDLVNEYWPNGFRGISVEGLRGLLDEMCGLGVLVRADEGYRLRSPNLVHLMGTREDIFSRLLELSQREAVTHVFNADVHRESLGAGRHSAFTHSQARTLAKQNVGACLVFGSKALGLVRAEEAISRFLPDDLPDGVLGKHAQVPDSVNDGGRLRQWLEDHWQKHRKYKRLLVIHRVATNSPAKEMVEAALEFCGRHQKSRASWIRVFLIFDPASSWRWMQIPERSRERLEDRADAVVALSRWTRDAIHLRLAANEKMDTEAVCEHVERVTGGWPFLLDRLFKKCGSELDPRRAIDEIELALSDEGDLKSQFKAALGIDGIAEAMQLLRLFQSIGESVDREFLLELAREKGKPAATTLATTEFLLRLSLLEEHTGEIRIQQQVAATLGS